MLQKVRQLKSQSRGARQAGFTIIEVMIVLAIAGIIMAIVFLAIPALQRNNRNTQRKNDASRLAGLIADYIANNNGAMPSGFGSSAGQLDLTGTTFSIITAPTAVANLPTPLPATPPAADTVLVYNKASCNGNSPQAASSTRSYVVWFGIEGPTTVQCISS